MKDYFIGLFAASLVCSVISVLASGTGGEKYVKYLCALVCIIMVVSPLVNINFNDISFEFESSEEAAAAVNITIVAGMSEELLLEYVNEILFDEYGIYARSVSINIECVDNTALISGVTVYIAEEDKTENVKKRLRELLGIGIEVLALG